MAAPGRGDARAFSRDRRTLRGHPRGRGQSLLTGNDISEFENVRSTPEQAKAYGEDLYHALDAVKDSVHPTVALIEGVCVGGGLELAALCDLRICGESSRFGVPIKRLGLVMAYPEIDGLLALVGRAVTLEILLEGRVFGAAEAKEKGLVTRVVPDSEVAAEAMATAHRIAEGAPLVARWHKKFVNRLARPEPLSADDLEEGYACYATEDFQIGYRSFLEKKPPVFKGH